jgi:hypothetical protein
MKSLLLASAMACFVATACFADDGDGQFWVVGNHANNRCDIVTSNPIIDGDIWFGSGPYKSMDDARLARSTISECPKADDPPPQR